ncbi:hypothetical protein KORDIASMS9_02256 [Kordia sp. SMS9]|uniref:hypothetical protein n=1 Tax=Kordia sp. SMS9 TaxID=2282170 RepID=UPI000E0FFC6C|nr:hypothetical protein [Kordia sp. SMS9]AXG70027.1 hypothetical protein KORDIASMS9_02256 [Kordia sp. SMS9]
MKKLYVLSLVVFHIIGFQSCTPEALNNTNDIQACCGDEGELPPPPPPPPPGDGLGD